MLLDNDLCVTSMLIIVSPEYFLGIILPFSVISRYEVSYLYVISLFVVLVGVNALFIVYSFDKYIV